MTDADRLRILDLARAYDAARGPTVKREARDALCAALKQPDTERYIMPGGGLSWAIGDAERAWVAASRRDAARTRPTGNTRGPLPGDRTVSLHTRVTPRTSAALDALATRANTTRSRAAADLLDTATADTGERDE